MSTTVPAEGGGETHVDNVSPFDMGICYVDQKVEGPVCGLLVTFWDLGIVFVRDNEIWSTSEVTMESSPFDSGRLIVQKSFAGEKQWLNREPSKV